MISNAAQRLSRIYAGGTKLGSIYASDAAGVLTRIYYALRSLAGSTPQFVIPGTDSWAQFYSFNVVGNGRGVLTAQFFWGSYNLQFVGKTRRFRMTVNGVVVNGELSNNYTTGSWSGTHTADVHFRDGDVVAFWGADTGGQTNCRTVNINTYTVAPV